MTLIANENRPGDKPGRVHLPALQPRDDDLMAEFKPRVPLIYQRMERGEIPKWLGLFVIVITWAFLVIPALCLTFPVWGSVAAYKWLKKPKEHAPHD